MAGLAVFALMLAAAMLPFGLVTVLVRGGQAGLALTLSSVIGATLAIFLFAAGRPFGIDPVFAMAAAMLVCFPALLGCAAGGLLGWLMRKRDDSGIK